MKMKLTMTRRDLAEKAYNKITKEVTGEVKPLPGEARRIAVVIQKFYKIRRKNNMSINIKDLMSKANSVTNLTSGIGTGGTSKMSVTVVYNRNGKRIKMNRKLVEALKLTDIAQISFVPEEGIVLLGKYLTEDTDKCISLTLKDEYDKIKKSTTGKKIAYSAEATFSIASNYGIDFSKITSKSFSSIEIDDSDPDSPVAVITIKGA